MTEEQQLQQEIKDRSNMKNLRVNLLSDEQKKHIIVEERFSFFQIENKLRTIVERAADNLRTRIVKEHENVRQL